MMENQVLDFAVIGAGMAGASVAWRLARSGASVVVLERESQPGYHATGRSAAMFMESYGTEQIRALTRASRAFYSAPPEGFCEQALLQPRSVLYIGTAGQEPQLDEALDAMDIDVAALHQGFLRGMVRAGARLRCGAELAGAARDGQGLWTLTLQDGTQLRTRAVVNAAGAWADAVARLCGAQPLGIEPRRRSAFTFAAPESFYFKPDAGQLLGSPANADPVPAHDVVAEELDVAMGIDRIESLTRLRIRRPRHVWAGLRSFAPDDDFVIGWDARCDGFFWLAGQGGYGIQTAAGASAAAAALLVREPLPAELRDQGVDAGRLSPARFAA
jgi:D-arginine dehydrogenase